LRSVSSRLLPRRSGSRRVRSSTTRTKPGGSPRGEQSSPVGPDVATSGAGGLDCSPRGDPAGFVRIADDRTLLIPDRRGNNRLDTLRNLVEDPRIGLLFLIPGVGTTIRVNGTAVLSTDDDLLSSFVMADKKPATVIVVTVESVYTQCPKALVRSHLWDPARHVDPSSLPTPGQMHAEIIGESFDGDAYDATYPERIRQTIY
jgi:PPOX class probable FMN-dependent enzyme